MRNDRERVFDAAAAERILSGAADGPRQLIDLLMAAAAPAQPGELAGEQTAVAEFRAARSTSTQAASTQPASTRPASTQPASTQPASTRPASATPAHRRTPGAPWWPRFVTVKVGALGLACVVGGVALAAGTGALPRSLSGRPAVQTSPLASARATVTSPANGDQVSATPMPTPLPSAALSGLCRAYLAQVAKEPARGRDLPGFSSLVAAAGDEENVISFCQAELDRPTTESSDPGISGGLPAHTAGPPSPHPAISVGQD